METRQKWWISEPFSKFLPFNVSPKNPLPLPHLYRSSFRGARSDLWVSFLRTIGHCFLCFSRLESLCFQRRFMEALLCRHALPSISHERSSGFANVQTAFADAEGNLHGNASRAIPS